MLATNNTDPNLINPWGGVKIGNTLWFNDNGTGLITNYSLAGTPLGQVITVPFAPTIESLGSPSGLIYNNTTGFQISASPIGPTAPSYLLGCTESGLVYGWSAAVSTSDAITAYTGTNGASFKGLALLNNYLFVANLSGVNMPTADQNPPIIVLDSSFNRVPALEALLQDPSLPLTYSAYNIVTINGALYVAYALSDEGKIPDNVPGAGLGFLRKISIKFSSTNPNSFKVRIKPLVNRGPLNGPWGIGVVPANFGDFSCQLMVGNFSDGFINVFSWDGCFLGSLNISCCTNLSIDGLWSIFPVGNSIYLSAGPLDETAGVLARLDPVNQCC